MPSRMSRASLYRARHAYAGANPYLRRVEAVGGAVSGLPGNSSIGSAPRRGSLCVSTAGKRWGSRPSTRCCGGQKEVMSEKYPLPVCGVPARGAARGGGRGGPRAAEDKRRVLGVCAAVFGRSRCPERRALADSLEAALKGWSWCLDAVAVVAAFFGCLRKGAGPLAFTSGLRVYFALQWINQLLLPSGIGWSDG